MKTDDCGSIALHIRITEFRHVRVDLQLYVVYRLLCFSCSFGLLSNQVGHIYLFDVLYCIQEFIQHPSILL